VSDTADRLSRALDGRYRIVREVGAGGMATVYLADDLRHNRQVALKVLRPELAATMGPERFFREIQVAARLQHPHILPLHDSGEADGFLFFVMPFVSGESLRARLDRIGELPVTDAVRILIEVADALSYSHSQGVVHRDIKPDNVMLSGRHALVTDFGVAKAVSEAAGESKVTTAGVALGTPAYMAPEQAVADPQIDHRVDLYALGVLGYELLTGRTPFQGLPPQQMLMAHVTEAPDPVRKYRDACTPELEAIIMRCLAKRAADRFQSADEVLHALEPLVASSGGITPTQSRPASTAGLPAEPVRKRVPAVAFIGSGVAILASLFVVLMSGGKRKSAPLFDRVQLTSSGYAIAPALSPDGTRLALGERRCVDDGECVIDIRVQDMGGAGSTAVVEGLVGLRNIEWSSDGRWLVFSGTSAERYGVFSVLALGGTPRYLACCIVSIGSGDTLMTLDPAPLRPDAPIIRRFTIADGRQVDSLQPVGWNGVMVSAWEIPGTQRILVSSDLGGRDFNVQLIDRTGQVLDSLALNLFVGGLNELRASDHGFSVGVENRLTGTVDFVRYRIDSKDRIVRDPEPIAVGISAQHGSHVSRDGQILVVDGPTEYAVSALERSSVTSTTFTRRLVDRSTTSLTGAIAPAGDRLFIMRQRPSDPRTTELSVVPFGGGAATALGTERDLFDWDWQQDSRGVIVVTRVGTDSIAVVEIDATNGQRRPLATLSSGRGTFETVAGGGYVHLTGINQLDLRGLRARTDTVLTITPALGEIIFFEPSPDGRTLATIGWSASGDSLEMHAMALEDGRTVKLASFPGEGARSPAWMPDGSLLVAVAQNPGRDQWFRVPAGGGTPIPLPIKLSVDASYRVSLDGLRAVARERVERSDIFLLRPAKGSDK